MKRLALLAIILAFGCSPEKKSESVRMVLSETLINMDSAGGEAFLDVQCNYAWDSRSSSSWLAVDPMSAASGNTTVRLIASANSSGNSRRATVGFRSQGQTKYVTVRQPTAVLEGYYRDGDIVQLQTATGALGRGVDLVFMGDGYTLSDMAQGSGKYETDMRAAVEHFFSIYPFSTYRTRFNAWMIVGVSNQSGISVQNPATTVDNKFKSVWEGGQSTGIECNTDIVSSYVSPVLSRTGKQLSEMTVIMPINASMHAGTCEMHFDGYSIAMIPVSSLFKNILIHESGGHGFAKVGDEYIYNETTIPADRVDYIKNAKESYGFYANFDFSANIAQTSWSGFAGNSKYSMVSTFEGASTYRRGIWRPEQNSCMNDGTLYFNAPTRWAQVKRMYELEGVPYTFSQFLSDDTVPAVPPPPTPPTSRSGEPYRFAPPIVVMPEGRMGR